MKKKFISRPGSIAHSAVEKRQISKETRIAMNSGVGFLYRTMVAAES
ncbi:hypothetical protein MKA46_14365 [[Clostridium] innocuum]|nr:hypothetical protein [[Clostridium] innocuum]